MEGLAVKNVFVTGAYGLLGAWLVDALLEDGADVTVLKRDDNPRAALALLGLERRVNIVRGDLRDFTLMQRALGEYEVDTVFHLAAQTIVGTANRSPVPTFEANIRGTWTLLEACRLHGEPSVVVAASDKAYGSHDELPYREDFALEARFPYDVSKACTDLISRSYFHTYGLPVAVTRLANIYGGGDTNRSRLVPEAVAAALGGRSPIIRSDGTPERDFLYVEDAAAASLTLAGALESENGARGEAFNAGGERPHAVREVVDLICKVAGSDVEPDIRGTGTPKGEIDRQYVDSTKLRTLTGWRPEVELEEGLRRTVEWYRSHPEALAS
ncbi:MAG: NAD-dependent epimerase/dehydratase [Solirubrobacterales bacterium]|nr:NAD-dependent epimerase/dehydratase [Solirubrobacterales bacterium]